MGGPMRFGCVCLHPAPSRSAWAESVRRIDGWGFDTLLLPDHLGMWPPFTPLVAAAATSERLRFGTQVLNVEFWNPVLLAREAAAVDVLIDGRLELGFGAGHAEEEFRAAGLRYPRPGERVDHLGEVVPLVQRLLAGETVTADGHHRLAEAALGPDVAPRQVPVMIGGNGDRVLGLAARLADIVGLVGFTSGTGRTHSELGHFDWSGLGDRIAVVHAGAGERDPVPELSVLVQAVVVTDRRQAATADLAARFEQPVELLLDSPFVMIGSVDELAEHTRRLRDEHGVMYVTCFEPSAAALAHVIDRIG